VITEFVRMGTCWCAKRRQSLVRGEEAFFLFDATFAPNACLPFHSISCPRCISEEPALRPGAECAMNAVNAMQLQMQQQQTT
jgi:hypothetical protein